MTPRHATGSLHGPDGNRLPARRFCRVIVTRSRQFHQAHRRTGYSDPRPRTVCAEPAGALSDLVIAFSDGKPVSTFPENALA